jgi:CheY-like chemotaxis protein
LTATTLVVEGVSGLCLVVTDLTDREARIAAEAANRAKDRFLAALSHELRTPLAPIVMTVSAMEMDSRLPEDLLGDLAMIRRNVQLETRLIDDLLDLSRAITGKLRLRLEPTSVRGLIENVLQMIQSDVNQKALQVRCDWAARFDRVHGDPTRLQQVIWNVIKNAVKFSSEHGAIEIRLLNPDTQTLLLEIQDYGIGIDPLRLRDIFEAFEQGNDAVASQAGGLGLGLTIAKAIVDMHSGSMSAESRGVGMGTTISVLLPITSLELSKPAASTAYSGDTKIDKPLRLLLVEDHSETAAVLARLLKQKGHEVEIAGTVAAALSKVAERDFDLVLSDIGLPDGNGHDLMKQIREKYSIPGVALTGYGMEDDLSRSRDVGFAAHVVKPVDMAELHAVIRRVCGTS